jgi:hypothetical protein
MSYIYIASSNGRTKSQVEVNAHCAAKHGSRGTVKGLKSEGCLLSHVYVHIIYFVVASIAIKSPANEMPLVHNSITQAVMA